MFGLGKWKPLWRVCGIGPSFLIPGGDGGNRWDGRGFEEVQTQEDLTLTH